MEQTTAVEKSFRRRKKEEYDRVKSEVKELEQSNFSELLLFRSGGDWFKMGGNSLLIYYFDIAKKILDLKPTIQPDTDYSKTIFEDGILSFRGIDGIRERLKKAEVLKEVKSEKTIVRFRLNFSVRKEEIEELKERLREERETAMAVLRPMVILYPVVYREIRHVQKRVFEVVRKMSSYERDYNGNLMADYSRRIAKYYLMLNNGMLAEKEGWKKIIEMVNLLMIEVTFASELGEIRHDIAVSVGAELVKIKREIENNMKVEEKHGGTREKRK